MEDKYIQSFKSLNYASLDGEQERKLKEIERGFNEEFGTEFYLMAMKKD